MLYILHFTLMPTTAKCKAHKVAISRSEATRAVIQTEHVVPEIIVPTVDEIVDDQAFYIKLCEEQSVVFRQMSRSLQKNMLSTHNQRMS